MASHPVSQAPSPLPPPPPLSDERAPEKHLNLNVRGLNPSATVTINERSNALRAQGRKIYKLGLGQSPFPVPQPVVDALKANAHQKDYLPVSGLRALREAVAKHHSGLFGVDRRTDDVLVGPGSKELMFLLQLVYYGDLVIPTPTWVSYAPQAQIIGRHVRLLPTRAETGWRLTPDQIDALCRRDPSRPRILILNYPSNPTGTTYDREELAEIARLARRYRLILLSDEIYGRLHHRQSHTSIVGLYPEGTIFSGGLSKWCGAGGWRLGMFVFPPQLHWLQEAMAAVASETFTSTSAPIQYAAVTAFLPSHEIDAYVARSCRILAALGAHLTETLRRAGLRVVAPDGAFYLFPDFSDHADELARRGITSSTDLCERLLEETGVAILPGRDFGRGEEELTARLAYVNFDGGAALDAVSQLADDAPLDEGFLRQHCRETVEAVERLCAWLGSPPAPGAPAGAPGG